MDYWLLLTKFSIFLYVIVKYSAAPNQITLFLLIGLLYSSLNLLYHLVKRASWKYLLSGASLIILIIGTLQVNPLYLLLCPLNIYEFLQDTVGQKIKGLILLLFLLFFKDNPFLAESILSSLLTFLVFHFSNETRVRIKLLQEQREELYEKNNSLKQRLNRELEYEHQLKYLSQLEERNQIAQAIHDQVGHTLAGSLMQLEAAKLLVNSNVAQTQEIISNVLQILREGMENLRVTLRNIKPPPEQLGINRLKLLCDNSAANQTFQVTLHYHGELEFVSYQQWKVICENVAEALTNAVKYSQATLIKVNLEVLHKYLKIEVKDNGIGANLIRKGLGITGIEERTASLGGKVIVDGSQGFSVITLLPIAEVKDGT